MVRCRYMVTGSGMAPPRLESVLNTTLCSISKSLVCFCYMHIVYWILPIRFYKLSGSCFFYISLCNQLCNCFKLLIPLLCCVLQYDSERTHGVLLCHQVRLLQEKNETRNRQVRPIWVKKWLDPNRNKFNPFRNSCFFALYSVASRHFNFSVFSRFSVCSTMWTCGTSRTRWFPHCPGGCSVASVWPWPLSEIPRRSSWMSQPVGWTPADAEVSGTSLSNTKWVSIKLTITSISRLEGTLTKWYGLELGLNSQISWHKLVYMFTLLIVWFTN